MLSDQATAPVFYLHNTPLSDLSCIEIQNSQKHSCSVCCWHRTAYPVTGEWPAPPPVLLSSWSFRPLMSIKWPYLSNFRPQFIKKAYPSPNWDNPGEIILTLSGFFVFFSFSRFLQSCSRATEDQCFHRLYTLLPIKSKLNYFPLKGQETKSNSSVHIVFLLCPKKWVCLSFCMKHL